MRSGLAPTGTPGPWPQLSFGSPAPEAGQGSLLPSKLSVHAKLKLLSSYAGA